MFLSPVHLGNAVARLTEFTQCSMCASGSVELVCLWGFSFLFLDTGVLAKEVIRFPPLFFALNMIKLRWALLVTYTIIQSITSSEMCSLHTHLEQWAPQCQLEQVGVRCLAQGSHLSRGPFLPQPRFEPTTSNYKSNALSTRPRLPNWKTAERASQESNLESFDP